MRLFICNSRNSFETDGIFYVFSRLTFSRTIVNISYEAWHFVWDKQRQEANLNNDQNSTRKLCPKIQPEGRSD